MDITKAQLARLQTLYSQLARHEIGVGVDRESRIRWATERLRKPVSSFKNLSGEDAGFLIDSIQRHLNVKAPLKHRLPRDQARRAGLDGRKDGAEFEDNPQLVTAADLALIQRLRQQLGWSEEAFRNFIESARSPLGQRADKTIRTTSDANKVLWAMKRVARQRANQRKTA
jgi:hypothetical protein